MNRLGYLSGAPRVSTRPDAELSAPRAHVLGVIKGFQSEGWEVHPFIVGDRLPRIMIGDGSGRLLSSSRISRFTADLSRVALGHVNATRAWRELGPRMDWVYERLGAMQALGHPFAERGIPWILETNALLHEEAKLRKTTMLPSLVRRSEVHASQRCDVLVSTTPALKTAVVSCAAVSPDKVVVMPNGVDTEELVPGRHTPRRLHQGFTVGFVGTMWPWQGIDLLLETVKVLRENGLDISVSLVGDGEMRGLWQQLAHDLGLEPYVAFVGRVNPGEVPAYISGFDVCYSGQQQMSLAIYPSPMKLYEYMAMAKPVIAAAFEVAASTVTQGVTRFLFRPGDVHELKEALARAYETREHLPELGRRAREHVERSCTWDIRVRTLISQAKAILKRKYSPDPVGTIFS